MSPGFFRKKAKAPSDTEFRGPLDLVPGDRVFYYQQEFTLAGVVFLVKGKERRCQYHFLDASEMHFVLAFDAGSEPQITLEHPLPEAEHPDTAGDSLEFDDTSFALKASLDVTAFCIGGIPGEKGSKAACRFFEDEDEMEVLNVEDWDGYIEVRRGDVIHENELVVKRQRDEDDWEIKPPPRIDLRSLNESRREKQLAEQEASDRRSTDELAVARQKLAAFSDEPDPIEDEDAVALSDIVDPQYRFGGRGADDSFFGEATSEADDSEAAPTTEAPPEKALPVNEVPPDAPATDTELPSLELPAESEDPFHSFFEGAEQDEAPDYVPDPYQAYMEDEREEDFSDGYGDEELPPEPDRGSTSADAPISYLTEDTPDEFLNAGVYEDDEDEI